MLIFLITYVPGQYPNYGGHYYDLLSLLSGLALPCRVYVLGQSLPRVFLGHPSVRLASPNISGMAGIRREIRDNELSVKLVHSFDYDSAELGQLLAWWLRVPFVFTKAGGPPRRLWPCFKNMIFVHEKDMHYHRTRTLVRPVQSALISQRVPKPSETGNGRSNPFVGSDEDCLKILRIARLQVDQRESIIQTINLGHELRPFGIRTKVAIVGVCEEDDFFDGIEEADGVRFYTEDSYCRVAADLITYADVVVGAGRSFMEGMALGKLMFFPLRGEKLPCFADPENYEQAREENFSGRVSRDFRTNPLTQLGKFLTILGEKQRKEYYSEYMRERFAIDCEDTVGARRTLEFYEKALTAQFSDVFIYALNAWMARIAKWIYVLLRIPKVRDAFRSWRQSRSAISDLVTPG